VRQFGVPYVRNRRTAAARHTRVRQLPVVRQQQQLGRQALALARSALETTSPSLSESANYAQRHDSVASPKKQAPSLEQWRAQLEQRRLDALEREKQAKQRKERERERQHQLQLEEVRVRLVLEARNNESEQQQIERVFREQRLLDEAQAERLRAEAAMTEKIDRLECVTCLQAVATHAYVQCGHLCVCAQCVEEQNVDNSSSSDDSDHGLWPSMAARSAKCPVCMRPDQRIVRIHIP
jgi:hypothetical protein